MINMGETILLIIILLLTVVPLCHMAYIINTRDIHSYWKLFLGRFSIKKKKPKKNTLRFTKSREEFEVLNQIYIECTIVDGFINVGKDHHAYQIVKDAYYHYSRHVTPLVANVKLKNGRELVIYDPYHHYYYVGISNKGK